MPRKKRRAISQACAIWTLLLLSLVSAGIVTLVQSGAFTASTGTGSGSSILDAVNALEQENAEAEWEQRKERSAAFFSTLNNEQTAFQALARAETQNIDRRTELRDTCSRDFRAASKFTKFSTALRCMKADLLLEEERLRKRTAYMGTMLGVNEDTRALALTRLTLLGDALRAIVTGIESDVFVTVEDLLESKGNLFANYRAPARLLLVKLRAEQLRTWADNLVTESAFAAEQETWEEEEKSSLLAGLQCMTEADTLLGGVRSAQASAQAEEQLRAGIEQLRLCTAALRTAWQTATGEQLTEGAQSSSSRNDAELSRRLRRRLDENYRTTGD